MRLHWFREHKQVVYYVICPAIVLSMSIFGFGQIRGCNSTTSGPAVAYTVGDKEGYLSAADVLARRITLYKFVNYYEPRDNRREDNPTTDNIGLFAAEVEYARQRGFEIGSDELKEFLRNAVKYKVMSIDRTEDVKVTKDLYEKLLQQMDMTAGQFEQLVHDLTLREKFHSNLQDSIVVSDPQLFARYSAAKENVRIRYKMFKSDDFVKEAAMPKDEEIKAYFEKHLSEKSGMQYKDVYMTPATMSLEALAYKDDKIFADIKPATDAELKATYENYKSISWNDPAKKGTYKPFDSVKAEVEKAWHTDRVEALKRTVEDNVAKALNELNDAETKAKDPAVKEAKPIDIAGWAAAHKMIRWETPEQTEEKYSQGKFEVNAPDLSLGTSLFDYSKKSPNQPEETVATQMKNMYKFTPFKWIDSSKPELGGIVARAKKFNAEITKTPEQAKDKIVENLKIVASVDLAKKAAEKQHDAWKRGEGLPKLEELDEVVSDKKENHPIVRSFRASPKALGEVLEVADGRPESDKFDFKDMDKKWFYVGCAVERKLPTLSQFALVPESEWSREEAKHGKTQQGYRMKSGIVDDDYKSELGLMVEQIKSNVIHVGNRENEPDVRTSFHDSHNSND